MNMKTVRVAIAAIVVALTAAAAQAQNIYNQPVSVNSGSITPSNLRFSPFGCAVITSPASTTAGQNWGCSMDQYRSIRILIMKPDGTAATFATRTGDAPASSMFASLASTATADAGAIPNYYVSAASTNSTSIKGTAGTLYSFNVTNTTATPMFVRLYDSASAPTCSSATGIKQYMVIPGNADSDGAGFINIVPSVGLEFESGIGFCITAAVGTTDTTSTAANDVLVSYSYR